MRRQRKRSMKIKLFNKPSTVKKRRQRSRYTEQEVIARREAITLYRSVKRKNESPAEYRKRLEDKKQRYKKKMNDALTKMTTKRVETMKEAIDKAMKEGLQALHRTVDENDPSRHRANVCIICDCFISGTDSIKYLQAGEIRKHKRRIGVDSYNAYYKTKLHPDLVKHYRVSGLDGILLSPSSKKTSNGYVTCSTCYSGMSPSHRNKPAPPKFSIANGFVIGSIPKTVSYEDNEGRLKNVDVENEEHVTEVLRAYLAPIRPYGHIFAYSGGAHQAIRGHFSYFEMDQSHLCGVMNCIDPDNAGKTIYCMNCGRMTPKQKEIIRKRVQIDPNVYKCLLSWFIKSGHPGYKDLPLPQDAPTKFIVLEDRDSTNNTDTSVNEKKEEGFEGGTYYFSSAQEPCEQGRTSVYDSEYNFALAMINRSAPTLLAIGGQYAKSNEIKVENVLPFAFPYGIGGPKMNRR